MLRDRHGDTSHLCLTSTYAFNTHSETTWFKLFGRHRAVMIQLLTWCMWAYENKRNWDEIKKIFKKVLAEEVLHWEQWKWMRSERNEMKRISPDKADEKGVCGGGTWINDEEKKTTTSTALAVGRFHLDGASHLERGEKKKRGNGEVRSRRLGVGGGCRRKRQQEATKPELPRSPSHILMAALRCWSKCLSCRGEPKTPSCN